MENSPTSEKSDLKETKLVDIMKDFEIQSDTQDEKMKILEQPSKDESIILVKAGHYENFNQETTNQTKLPNWTVSPYDLGGHSPYFSSQRMFTAPSSFFFLTFSRYSY